MFFSAVEYTALLASPSLSDRHDTLWLTWPDWAGRSGRRRMEDGSARCSQDRVEFEIDEGYPDENEEDLGCEEDQECREGLVLRVVSGIDSTAKEAAKDQQQNQNEAAAETEQAGSRSRSSLLPLASGPGLWVRKSTST